MKVLEPSTKLIDVPVNEMLVAPGVAMYFLIATTMEGQTGAAVMMINADDTEEGMRHIVAHVYLGHSPRLLLADGELYLGSTAHLTEAGRMLVDMIRDQYPAGSLDVRVSAMISMPSPEAQKAKARHN